MPRRMSALPALPPAHRLPVASPCPIQADGSGRVARIVRKIRGGEGQRQLVAIVTSLFRHELSNTQLPLSFCPRPTTVGWRWPSPGSGPIRASSVGDARKCFMWVKLLVTQRKHPRQWK